MNNINFSSFKHFYQSTLISKKINTNVRSIVTGVSLLSVSLIIIAIFRAYQKFKMDKPDNQLSEKKFKPLNPIKSVNKDLDEKKPLNDEQPVKKDKNEKIINHKQSANVNNDLKDEQTVIKENVLNDGKIVIENNKIDEIFQNIIPCNQIGVTEISNQKNSGSEQQVSEQEINLNQNNHIKNDSHSIEDNIENNNPEIEHEKENIIHETILFEPETEKTTVCPIENEREETIKKFDELMNVARSSIYLEKTSEQQDSEQETNLNQNNPLQNDSHSSEDNIKNNNPEIEHEKESIIHETILFEPETEKTTVCPIENEREETIKKFDELMYVERSSIYLEKANELKNKYYNKQNEFDDDSYQKFFTNDFLNKYEQFKNYVNNWNIEIRDQGLNDSINVYKINFKNNLLRFFNRTKDEDLNISQLKQVAQKYYLYQVRKNSIDILYRHYINKSPIHCFRFENDLHYDSNILEIIIKEKNECKYVELKVSKKNGYEKIKVDSSISSDTHLEVLFINKNEEFTLLESINKETLENLQQNFDKNSIVSQVNVEDIEHILEKNEENANNYVSAACKYLLNECQPYWLELKDENKGFEERILAMENLHNLYKWFNIRFNTIHKILNGNKIKTLLIGQDTFNNPNISNVKILKLKDQSLVLSFLVNENQIYISESSKLTLYKGFNKNKNSRMWYKKPTN